MRKMVKKVPQQEVFTPNEASEENIYICVRNDDGRLFKLSKTYTGTNPYQWLALEISYRWYDGNASGEYNNVQEALEAVYSEDIVYEFNNTKELAQWLLER